MQPPALAVDIGGTKLAAAVVTRDGEVTHHAEVPTPRSADADVIGDALVALVRRVVSDSGYEGELPIGVGSAGPIDLDAGTISPVNIAAWREFPVVERLSSLGRHRPKLAGDGHCFTLGESRFGAGRGSRATLGMVVSTGIGAGLVFDGQVHFGLTGNAAHLGHVSVDPAGPDCPCGGRGCIEAIASGPSMVRYAQTRGWAPPEGAPADGIRLTSSARAGDAAALDAFARAADAIARGIVLTATMVELDRVVIGGGLSAAGDLLFEPIRAALERHAFLSYIRGVSVVPAELGRVAGLVGAAALAFDT